MNLRSIQEETISHALNIDQNFIPQNQTVNN